MIFPAPHIKINLRKQMRLVVLDRKSVDYFCAKRVSSNREIKHFSNQHWTLIAYRSNKKPIYSEDVTNRCEFQHVCRKAGELGIKCTFLNHWWSEVPRCGFYQVIISWRTKLMSWKVVIRIKGQIWQLISRIPLWNILCSYVHTPKPTSSEYIRSLVIFLSTKIGDLLA